MTIYILRFTFEKNLNGEATRSARLTSPTRQSFETAAAPQRQRHLFGDLFHAADKSHGNRHNTSTRHTAQLLGSHFFTQSLVFAITVLQEQQKGPTSALSNS
jgi:hypothetical protein